MVRFLGVRRRAPGHLHGGGLARPWAQLPRGPILASSAAVLLVALGAAGYAGPPASAASRSATSRSNRASGPTGTIALVAYSTPKTALSAQIAAFRATPEGRGITFVQSYGPSGTQANQVANGLPADVVNLSLAPDMNKLARAGIVSSNWAKAPYGGMVTDSVVAFVVRPGNPKGIHSWSDLTRPGVQVLTPNPFSSGSSRWNILAAYGSQLKEGKSLSQAQQYLGHLFHHVVSEDTSASAALQTFLAGKGDVLLDYEDEALAAQRAGEPIRIVVPSDTILIQNPIAVTSDSKDKPAARAFVNYLLSPAGQRTWAEQGYRPVNASLAKESGFSDPPGLFTVDYLGGWARVDSKLFDPATGVVAAIERSIGTSSTGG